MNDNFPPSIPLRDRVAECQVRAAADRVRAEGMDTTNGRRKFEQSAASWDQRGELLGRLDASHNKREQLDAEAARFQSDRRAGRLADAAGVSRWEGEGGTTVALRPADRDPQVRGTGVARVSGAS